MGGAQDTHQFATLFGGSVADMDLPPLGHQARRPIRDALAGLRHAARLSDKKPASVGDDGKPDHFAGVDTKRDRLVARPVGLSVKQGECGKQRALDVGSKVHGAWIVGGAAKQGADGRGNGLARPQAEHRKPMPFQEWHQAMVQGEVVGHQRDGMVLTLALVARHAG